MSYVRIKSGYGHGRTLTNIEFPVVHGIKTGSRGFYIMVNGEGLIGFPQRNFKIQINSKDDVHFFETPVAENLTDGVEDAGTVDVSDPLVLKGHVSPSQYVRSGNSLLNGDHTQRDEQPIDVIRSRMIERFNVLRELSVAAARGTLRGLVVYGGAGVGKSFEVVDAMSSVNAYNKIKFQAMMENEDGGEAEDDEDDEVAPPAAYSGEFVKEDPLTGVEIPQIYTYHVQRGHITASGIYHTLYHNRHSNQITIFDDSDGTLSNEESLGVLKSALDTTSERVIMWTISGSRVDEIPTNFLYEGSIIFITNTNFEVLAKSGSKLSPHIEAILDRCLYLDLMLETLKEKLVRIDYVCSDLKMFQRVLLEGNTTIVPESVDSVAEELLQWTHENAEHVRDLSLRKMHHLANLRKSTTNWQRIAEMTLLKRRR